MSLYGYARVSSTDQNADRQLIALHALDIPAKHMFTDRQSGKDFDRPKYRALLKRLRAGDLLYVQSIDRLGRNCEQIKEEWRILTKVIGVDIVVIDMPVLDTRVHKNLLGTFIADTVLNILAFVAENERDSIRKRQAEGIAAARQKGVHMGRPAKNPPENFGELVRLWEKNRVLLSDVLNQCGMSKSTFYRRVREHHSVRGEKR